MLNARNVALFEQQQHFEDGFILYHQQQRENRELEG